MDGNIQKYQALIKTVEYGSFTKAAEVLGYTQSSVSKIGILPRLILKRIPYDVEIRSFTKPFYREIALAMRNRKTESTAVKRFVQYLKYRNE